MAGLEGDLNEDGIIDEMDRVRDDLGGDLNQLNERMRTLFEWQAYVKSAPLTSAAVALVAGYLLAPRFRSRVPQVVAAPAAASESKESAPSSLGALFTTVVLGGLARAGSVYVGDLLSQTLASMNHPTSESEVDSAPPFEAPGDLT